MTFSLLGLRYFSKIGLLAGLLAFADFSFGLLCGQPSVLVQSVVAQAPTGGTQRPDRFTPQSLPVEAPIVESAPQAPGNQRKGHTRWIWVLGVGVLGIMGFFLLRILTAKPKAMPTATEDENARVRRHQHRRGQGRTPASREEQRISETSRADFMNAPMRQAANEASEPGAAPASPTP